jgi:hypothetical protein
MLVIHAETEQTDENIVAILIFDRMLNHDHESELSTADIFGNVKTYEMMMQKPELDVKSAEAATYFNNYENVGEEMELEENTAVYSAPKRAGIIRILLDFIFKCIKCYRWRCKWVC